MSQAGMRTRLRQLRALLSLTDNDFYEYLSELIDICRYPMMLSTVVSLASSHSWVSATFHGQVLLIPYSEKFSWGPVFAVLADEWLSAKIRTAK
jgi:hypothetical protein